MAYVNVAEWSPEHVAEWLRGLEYSLLPYVHFFLNNEIDGYHLLNLTADDLEDLHIFKVGHQQLILEAVELLRQLHYSLNSETLQSLAVKLGCKSRSLYNDLKLNGPQDHVESIRQERVSINVLSAVSEVLTSVKALVSWLDRLPFQHDPLCLKLKKTVLKLSIELASTTQRDQFAERPHALIKRNSLHLAELCDKFVQGSKDSLILQPASLDIAMIKKKPDEELGIHIKSTYSGVHIIGGIKDQSPAKRCNKVEKGDEIVQVNYQTVIGWQQKKLVTAMTEHYTELHLTLKKRPRHINLLGEVMILRPYRIPSKKTANKCHKWSDDNHVRGQDTCSTSNESECIRDDFNDDEDDSAFLPASVNHLILAKEASSHHRLFPGTTPFAVQRRATVSGASPTILKPPVNIEDLVNGVPRMKGNDNFGRSISHDPSCPKLNTEDVLKNPKSSSHHEEENKELVLDSDKSSEILDDKPAANTKSLSNTLSSPLDSTCGEICKRDRSPVPLMDALPVQEEGTVLENKSLSKEVDSFVTETKFPSSCVKNVRNCAVASAKADENSHSSDQLQFSNSAVDKQNCLFWEGADVQFSGRRPSAHDISNEIAGSKLTDINPMFLRKFSKIDTSPLCHGSTDMKGNSNNESAEMSSYQVVIVGGVPQKCINASKDSKEKGKGLEFNIYSHKKMESVRRLGSRHISCKDLGKGDCEGWLYKQKEKKSFFPSAHQWTKRWMVLKKHLLYCYRDKNDIKAECLISLPGSKVSPALECKTKKYAFKVCQQKTTFYFATDSQKELANWMNKMGLAAIAYHTSSDVASGYLKPELILDKFYSETEDSESGSPTVMRRSEDTNEWSSVSSASDHSFDFAQKSQKKEKNFHSVDNKKSSHSAFPKVIKRNASNKTLMHWINQNAVSNLEMKEGMPSNTSSLYTPVADSYTKSVSRCVESHSHKIFYNRSFSCTESYTHLKDNHSNLTGKASHETCLGDNSVPSIYNQTNILKKASHGHQMWNSIDEEYDILTSSLGRQQRALAKEITPGLVARMAVSYSNLSQKNSVTSSLSKKFSLQKGVPAPGYVAKISDSFDYLAKVGTSNNASADNKGKKCQAMSDDTKKPATHQHPNCKRSASESQVSKKLSNIAHNTEPLTYSSSLSSGSPYYCHGEISSPPEKFVSLLDKEYNKVFEGKKVSQQQLKSSCQANFNKHESGRREMRFFPSGDLIDSACSMSVQNKNSVANKGALEFPLQNSKIISPGGIPGNSENYFPCTVDMYASENRYMQQFERGSSNRSTISNSSHYSGSNFYDSSEGIENMGFGYTDQPCQANVGSINANNSDSYIDITFDKQSQILPDSANSHPSHHDGNFTLDAVSSDANSPKNTSFKFFNSPKFMKKLTSPKLDKKNIFKSKKQAKEAKRAEQKEISSTQSDSKKQAKEAKKAEQKEISSTQSERKFFGSPRLVRAIFGSPKAQKKVITVSSGVQTDNLPTALPILDYKKPCHDLNQNENFVTSLDLPTSKSSIHGESHEQGNISSKSSSNSSLNSNASNSLSPYTSSLYYVEARIKPQITISLPLVADKSSEKSPPETPRTPLKPTMGVAMLSKKRLPSISGESSVSISSKSSHDGSTKEIVQQHSEVSMDVNGDEEMLQVMETLQRVDVSFDGTEMKSKDMNCEPSS
ncbi:uncharacterized protein LOC118180902 [Stegodyphus dumicola]|uniref:uncharacterized protein LOC118180902 n=1 Tax=Stegodyphus dumicola TaxID=202533 RepID=UPI0015AF5F16|nr:uncharacterized protein LOC118180902 [Stegodyphus dumicola]